MSALAPLIVQVDSEPLWADKLSESSTSLLVRFLGRSLKDNKDDYEDIIDDKDNDNGF